MSYWSQKNAVVIGGSRGLGLAISQKLVAAGANVVLVARDEQTLASVSTALGPTASHIKCDIKTQSEVDALFEQLKARLSHLDACFHVTGKSARGAILDTSADDFHQLMDLNFYSVVRCSQYAAEWAAQSNGHLVLVGSLASKTASRYLGAYPATKFALAAYAQQLRLELADQGLHVLHVCTGPIKRDDAGRRYDDQAADLPEAARKAGGGVKLKAIGPDWLADRILQCCTRRKKELVVPWKAKILFAIAQLSPDVGDWLLAKQTKN
ncbi:MAG: SDR family oxidoreductase [Planctomycetales bacterium]|nr:SDR family oxidoreductase [Planctomycetales bacterium]